MARRGKKKGRPVSGWVIFDKPKGMGSTEAVSKIKWLFNAEKAGHAGTLDPLASGMLPIALGEATKTVPYVMDGTKVYRFTVTWGEERSTDDLEGQATKTSDKRPSREEVEALLPNYTGLISQIPPQFSAIKIDGERAYDLAREDWRSSNSTTTTAHHSKSSAPRAPMCARWRAIWAAISAASAIFPNCAASKSPRSRKKISSR
jgi:tRNA pseudouridine55 synthase